MNLEYALTADDYLKFHLHANDVIPAMKVRYAIFRWGVPCGAVTYFVYLAAQLPKDSPDKITAVVFIGMALSLFIIAPKLFAMTTLNGVKTLMRARQNTHLSGSFRVLVLPDELHFTSDASSHNYKWGAILKVTETPTHFFLWLSQREAIIVPRRAFESPEQEQTFGTTVRRYREAVSLAQ